MTEPLFTNEQVKEIVIDNWSHFKWGFKSAVECAEFYAKESNHARLEFELLAIESANRSQHQPDTDRFDDNTENERKLALFSRAVDELVALGGKGLSLEEIQVRTQPTAAEVCGDPNIKGWSSKTIRKHSFGEEPPRRRVLKPF